MRLDQEDTSAFNTQWKSGRYSYAKKILATDAVLVAKGTIVNAFDPGGADRVVTLPPAEGGRFYAVAHVGTNNSLTVKTATGTTLSTLTTGQATLLYSGDTEWMGVSASLVVGDFGYAGPGHHSGLVPDPGPGPALPPPDRRFLSELGWATVTGIAVSADYFKTMKGGVVTLTPTGAEPLEFTSANTAISILASAGTTPKSIGFTLNAANIDHDALFHYVADQHVAHSTVTLTAGLGLSGGGTIDASRTFDFAPTELTIATPTGADYVVWDVAAGGPRRALWSAASAAINHDTLLNWVANKHIDHSTVSVVASTGLCGGGDLTTSRTLSLDINSLTGDVPAAGDFIPFYDISGGDTNKTSVTTLNGVIDHNALLNYDAARHFLDAVSDGKTYGRKNGTWVEAGGGASVLVSDTPPVGAPDNSLWFESDTGLIYIRYNDGDSTQWVVTPPGVSASSIGAVAYTAQTLTVPQQTIARQNIYAAPFDAMAYSGLQINGSMEVSQEIGSNGITVTGYICDGWYMIKAGTMVPFAASQVSAIFPGIANRLVVGIATAQASLAAGDVIVVQQRIEGYRISRLAWGTVSAQPITIGFWSCHTRTGLYSVAVENAAANRTYVATYTQNVSGAPEYKTVTIPGCTDGTWPPANTTAMLIRFTVASGTTYIASAVNSWINADTFAAPGQVNAAAATTDNFVISGVVVLPGIEAPSAARSALIMRPFDQELVTCKRYWQQLASFLVPTNVTEYTATLPVAMRSAPTITGGGAGYANDVNNGVLLICHQTSAALQTLNLDARL